MQKSDMTTLFASLPESEKALVVQTLKQNGVNASLNPSTGEVIVPVKDYHESRMLLAGEGLPSSVPDGYDSLGDMPMGTSRSVEAIKIKQSLEAELSRLAYNMSLEMVSILEEHLPYILEGIAQEIRLNADSEYKCSLLKDTKIADKECS